MADDLWDSTFLEKAIKVMEHDPSVILCYPTTYIIDGDGLIKDTYDDKLLAEMTLYGKVYELPERLFSRRFHEISGSRKRGDDKHQAKRYKAAGSSLVDLRQCRSHFAHFASVRTAPLLLESKFRLYRYLTRVASWNREVLTAELSRYLRSIFPFHDGGAEWT